MNYKCRNPKGECRCCNPDLRTDKHGPWNVSNGEGVTDYAKYHSTPKYKEHITAALEALNKL